MAQLVRAPPCHGGGRRFESDLGRNGVLAQLGEHLPYKQRVTGSSPVGPTHIYGWVPEWPKGADCKSVSDAFGGSNPPPSIFPINGVPKNACIFRGKELKRSEARALLEHSEVINDADAG